MKKIYYTFAVLLIFMSACKKEASIKGEQQDAPRKTITYHLKNGGEVTVTINNKGEYVVGGDVILSKDQIAYLEYNKVGNGKETTPRSTFTTEYQKLWPGGIVYYTVNDPTNSSSIATAINQWEANTLIRFVQRTNQANYVDFSGIPSQGGGSSKLGMIGGRQTIELQPNSGFWTVIHEIGHAVGLMHEQLRADRDQYININYSNIQQSWVSEYTIYNPGEGSYTGPFDYQSVMIYPSYAGGTGNPAYPGNTTPQMTRKDGSTWGTNFYLSQGDIDGVNYLYRPIYIKPVAIYNGQESYYENSGVEERINEVHDVTYYFYSDPNFTIPINLTAALKIKVNTYTETQQDWNNSNPYSTVTPGEIIVPSGVSSIYIGQSIRKYDTQYGIVYGYYSTITSLIQGIGYKF